MKRTVSGAPDVQSPMNPGQIEQVVSSADCRQVEPQDSQNGGHRALQANIRDGETAGTSRLDANQPSPCGCLCHFGQGEFCACSPDECLPFSDPPLEQAPQISLEDRLFVALSARGSLSMCQAIVLATGAVQPFHVKDEDLVSLVEDFVFGTKGSRDGVPE